MTVYFLLLSGLFLCLFLLWHTLSVPSVQHKHAQHKMCVCTSAACMFVCETVSSCMHDSLRSVSEWLDSQPADGKQCVWKLSDYDSHKAVMRPSAPNEKRKHRQYFISLWQCTRKSLLPSSVYTNTSTRMDIIMCNVFHTFIPPIAPWATALVQYPDEWNPLGQNKPQPIITPARSQLDY